MFLNGFGYKNIKPRPMKIDIIKSFTLLAAYYAETLRYFLVPSSVNHYDAAKSSFSLYSCAIASFENIVVFKKVNKLALISKLTKVTYHCSKIHLVLLICLNFRAVCEQYFITF